LVELDDPVPNKKSVKIFFLIFFHNVVCGTTAAIFSKQAIMVKDMVYEEMATMDFCEVIIDSIKAGDIEWQGHKMLDQEKRIKSTSMVWHREQQSCTSTPCCYPLTEETCGTLPREWTRPHYHEQTISKRVN
jgi:hypothetical protein